MILLCDDGAVNVGPWGGIALQLYVGPGHEYPLLLEGGLIGVSAHEIHYGTTMGPWQHKT